jgi:hypothetical protein
VSGEEFVCQRYGGTVGKVFCAREVSVSSLLAAYLRPLRGVCCGGQGGVEREKQLGTIA